MAVPLPASEATFNPGVPVRLFGSAYAQSQEPFASRGYDVSNDAQRFLMVREQAVAETSRRLVVTLNWFEELKNKLAVK